MKEVSVPVEDKYSLYFKIHGTHYMDHWYSDSPIINSLMIFINKIKHYSPAILGDLDHYRSYDQEYKFIWSFHYGECSIDKLILECNYYREDDKPTVKISYRKNGGNLDYEVNHWPHSLEALFIHLMIFYRVPFDSRKFIHLVDGNVRGIEGTQDHSMEIFW
jgi:hypothetical protein